jgi:hypothetical protein
MEAPAADTLATVAAGRTALVARLRTIAARLEELPLDAAAEVLVLLEPAVVPGRPGPRRGQVRLVLEIREAKSVSSNQAPSPAAPRAPSHPSR